MRGKQGSEREGEDGRAVGVPSPGGANVGEVTAMVPDRLENVFGILEFLKVMPEEVFPGLAKARECELPCKPGVLWNMD